MEEEQVRVPVEVVDMKKDIVEHTYISVGEVVPDKQVDLYLTGTGYIEVVDAVAGEVTEEGNVLILLDDSKADTSSYTVAESRLRTVRDNLEAQIEDTAEQYDKVKALFDEGIATSQELDGIASQLESLKRELENAEVAYRNELSSLSKNLKDSVKNRIIESPVHGTIAAVYVKEGQAVSNQLAVSIIDDTKLFVKSFVSSDLKKLLTVGDEVRVKLDGDDIKAQKGIVYQINELPDISTKLFEVLIEVGEAEEYIVGDYAEVEFVIERYEALMVPMQAVITNGTSKYVYLHEDGELKRQLIETGRTSGVWIEVKNLNSIMEVVIRGQNQLTRDSDFIIIEN